MNKMRLTVASLAIALGFIANSCGSDDGPQPSIEGKWNYVKTVTQQNNGPKVTIPYEGDEPGCDDDYQQFAEGMTFHNVEYFQNQDDVCQEFVEDGIWEKDGDQLTVTLNGDTQTYTITRLTGSSLQYQQVTQASGVTFTATLYFTRIN